MLSVVTAVILSNISGNVGMPKAVDALSGDMTALDVIEAGIRPVESDPDIPYVGLGGAPNLLGEMECDAAVVDGSSHNAGVVAGLKGFASAFWVARQVLERSPHVAIGGEGAALFAAEMGAQPADMLSKKAREEYLLWRAENVPPDMDLRIPSAPRNSFVYQSADLFRRKDTVVFLVKDLKENIAAGGSTSGWCYKYPGRYGDTPLPGAGLWADNEGGACGCTHTGEMTARALTAKFVVDAMRRGAAVKDAVHESIEELRRLKGGYRGQVVVHAISPNGEPYAATTRKEEGLVYWVWESDSKSIRAIKPVVDTL